MSGALRSAWDYLRDELWEPLANFAAPNASAPFDLYSDLFAAVDEFLDPRPTRRDLEDARNNPQVAQQRFLALKGIDFINESELVHFLEEAHAVVSDYDISGYEELFERLLDDFLHKYNLRYRLDRPFCLRFLIPGSFTNLYEELHRFNSTNGHCATLLADFEHAFDAYVRNQSEANLKTCIAKASNFAEGLASATFGTAGTLGMLSDQLSDWPHEKIKEALKSLYGFCSDYPGIRHAGTPNHAIRALGSRDMTIASLLLLSFSGYLSPLIDENAILGI